MEEHVDGHLEDRPANKPDEVNDPHSLRQGAPRKEPVPKFLLPADVTTDEVLEAIGEVARRAGRSGNTE